VGLYSLERQASAIVSGGAVAISVAAGELVVFLQQKGFERRVS